MSELFNALQKLEQQEEVREHGPELPPLSGRVIRSSGRYLPRTVLIVLLFLAAPLCCFFILRYSEDNIKPVAGSVTAMPLPVLAGEQQKNPGRKDTKQEDAAAVATVISINPQVAEEKYSPLKDGSVPDSKMRAQEKTKPPAVTAAEKKVDMGHSERKRKISRAEKLRLAGNYEASIKLYQKVLADMFNPVQANNLAALLIQDGQYGEALKILTEAARMLPDDADIKYNLEIARRNID